MSYWAMVTFPNQCHRTQELILFVVAQINRVTLYKRFDTDNVISALVPDNLRGRNIHQFDILRHDNMGSHFTVHINLLVSGYV